ncbi:hypothetical protein A4U88_3445 [Serratia marcescens]|nr:hypothetical protein A4U88_3445 [Serratia marcescens]AXK23616.1 Hypothetical protein SmN45_1830 [Serratia marcescens]
MQSLSALILVKQGKRWNYKICLIAQKRSNGVRRNAKSNN